ncbi:unnamed protein product [Choristocarpus tenellus]
MLFKDSAPPTRRKWSSFTSSARSDGVSFQHWEKSNSEQGDYPYAR